MDIESELTHLKRRVATLEAIVGVGEQAEVVFSSTPPPPPPPPMAGAVSYSPVGSEGTFAPTATTVSTRPKLGFDFGIETLLRWAGVALVTLAGIFLVSTAISRGWVGPELQLLGAAMGGAVLLAGSVYLSESRRPWALALGCGGAVVLAASAIATYEWLDLVGPEAAIGLAALVTLGSLGVAIKTRLEGIALVACVAAMFGALETLSELGDAASLGWVAALILVSTGIGLFKQWPGLRLITGWLGALVLAGYAVSQDVDGILRVIGFAGTACVAAALWAGPIFAGRMADDGSSGNWGSFDWAPLDYRLVALVPGWVWVAISGLLSLEESVDLGIAALIFAAGFGLLASGSFGRIDKLVSMSTLFGVLTLVSVGFALVFDGPALMVALAGQAVTSYFLGRKLGDIPLQVGGYVVAATSSLLAVYEMLDALDRDGFENFGAVLATLVVVGLWIGAAAFSYGRDHTDFPFEVPFVGAWAISMLWLATLLSDLPQGLGLISAAWATMACAGLVMGLISRIAIVKNMALGTLGLTLVKLVTVDMAEVEVFWRVGLFFVVGVGLIALGLRIPELMSSSAASDEESAADQDAEPSNL